MDDTEIQTRIHRLVAEEHELRDRHRGTSEGLTASEQVRMHELEVRLDQAWDLLRRRQASRENGGDPDAERERPAAEVEGYLS